MIFITPYEMSKTSHHINSDSEAPWLAGRAAGVCRAAGSDRRRNLKKEYQPEKQQQKKEEKKEEDPENLDPNQSGHILPH